MPVTLTISANNLRLVSMNGKRVTKWGEASLAPGLVKNGHILQPQPVAAAIDALFRSLHVPRSGVTVAISGISFTYRILRLPRLRASAMTEAILRAAKKEIPLPLHEVYLSWQIIGGDKEEVELFLLGVPRHLIDAVVQTFKIAAVKLLGIDLKALALARAANSPNVLIANFEPDCFDIVLVADGIPTILHTTTPRSDATLEDNVRKLIDELVRTVDFYNVTHTARQIAPTTPLLLAGQFISDPATIPLIRKYTEFPVEIITPAVTFLSGFPVASYATNIGLSLKSAFRSTPLRSGRTGFRDINLDILASRRRAEVPPMSQGKMVLPTALIVALFLLALLVIAKTQAQSEKTALQGRLDVIARELRLARIVADETANTQTMIKNLLAEAAALKQQRQQVLGKSANDADIIKLLTGTLSARMDFSIIEISPIEVSVEGEATNRSDILSYAETLGRNVMFSNVRIACIDPGSTPDKLGFTIVARR